MSASCKIMKLYPRLLYSCSSLALWRVATAFTAAPTAVVTAKNADQHHAARHPYSTTSLQASKMDQSFETWKFDKPCQNMEWNKLVETELSVAAADKAQVEAADLVVIGVYPPAKDENEDEDEEDKEDEEPTVTLTGMAADIDKDLGGALSEVMKENAKAFKNGASAGSMTPTARVIMDGKAKRYVMMGLGPAPKEADDKKEEKKTGAGYAIGKAIATKCDEEKKIETCSVLLPEALRADDAIMQDLSIAFYQSLYSDNRYRTKSKIKKLVEDLKTVSFFSEASTLPDASAVDTGKKIATGVILCKDIVNAPHNVLNSESLANTARRIAKESGGTITCTILGKNECEKRGMGAFLGVARGSETEPQFIHLTYKPPSGKVNKKVGIVGKGLLFDTGGYNIKTQMMEMMKFDCGGSAAVLGAARALGELKPEGVEAHIVVAACENMINEKAYVPSDILTASNGKTIEVLNTDAEGRLTMADALVYVDKECEAESIIELSTLTGACMVALGKEVAAIFSDSDDLATELEKIAKATGDKSWRMPMEKSYNKQLESKIADIQNIGARWGGAITAALFLQNFVSKKKPFAHIDIAGP